MQVRVLLAELKKAEVSRGLLLFLFAQKFCTALMLQENTETCWLYILKSESAEKYYVGVSTDPQRRLMFHNSIEKGFTSRYRPWKLVLVKEYESRKAAMQAEKTVKSWKSQKRIIQLVRGEVVL